MANFIPKDPSLDPAGELVARGNVTEADMSAAIGDWKEEPPDPDFEEILEPELEDG